MTALSIICFICDFKASSLHRACIDTDLKCLSLPVKISKVKRTVLLPSLVDYSLEVYELHAGAMLHGSHAR